MPPELLAEGRLSKAADVCEPPCFFFFVLQTRLGCRRGMHRPLMKPIMEIIVSSRSRVLQSSMCVAVVIYNEGHSVWVEPFLGH